MARQILLLFSFQLAALTIAAQTIYLKYDADCMNRFEYATPTDKQPYVSYAMKLGENRFLQFDVGTETDKWVKDLPGKLTYCNDLTFDEAFAREVNDGSRKLFIVRESPTHYNVAPVDKAAAFQLYRNVLEFSSNEADFTLYVDNLVSNVNLGRPDSKMEVYLDGTVKTQCLTGYILSKKDSYRADRYKEFTLIPEIGIVEKRSVSGSNDISASRSAEGALRLVKVNDQPYKDFLTTVCDGRQAAYYDGVAESTPSEYDDLVPKIGANKPPAEGSHAVAQGETLYSLARRYGVSVADLRAWNNLQSTDVISIGQPLFVRQPSGMTTQPSGEVLTEKSGTSTSTTRPSGSGSTGSGYTGQGYWVSSPQTHTVKTGETVAQLAAAYGYTEERFRKMNGLSAYERISTGQKLRTNDCDCPTLESTTKGQLLPYEVGTGRIITSETPADVYYRPVKVHQVKEKETLYSIAKLYNTTPERILELNGLKKAETIQPQQRLYVQ